MCDAKMTAEKIPPRTPNWVDAYVGSRVRLRRMKLGLSQKKVGEAIGITFQQVQKYEKGINRIGARRLLDLAECLNVPISFFFPKDGADSFSLDRLAEPIGTTAQLGVTSEAVELAQLFSEITEPDLRKKIVSLVRVLSEHHQALNAKS